MSNLLQHRIVTPKALRLRLLKWTPSQCISRTQIHGIALHGMAHSGIAQRGIALLPGRRLIELQGQDAARFLQGLTTANIPSVNPAKPKAIYSAFLNAQGRLLQDVFIYHMPLDSRLISPISSQHHTGGEDQRFLIEVDGGQLDNLVSWLKAHKLRTKVSLRPLPPGEINVISAWNDSISSDEMSEGAAGLQDEDFIVLPDNRAPGFGLRVLSRGGYLPAVFEGVQSFKAEDAQAEQQYTLRRYAFGIPEGEKELVHQTALVQESNIDYMGGVDFQKGCYVGQELVIRTQHTGVVRKRILPCVLYKSGEPQPDNIEFNADMTGLVANGTEIKSSAVEGEKVKKGGTWLAGIGNFGLAICRLQDMAGLAAAGDIGKARKPHEWNIDRTRNPGMDDLKVMPIVPGWWRKRAPQSAFKDVVYA